MRTNQEIQSEGTPIISEAKIAEIKGKITAAWDLVDTKEDLIKDIEEGYIFGKYSKNEHYTKEFISSLVDAVDLEKNPPPIVEEIVVEEPIAPIIGG